MKKQYFCLLLGLFLILACSLTSTPVTPSANPNRVATAVSNTLTAKPALLPSSNGSNKQPDNNTPTATLTMAGSPTATTTPTITTTPANLLATLGTPVWQNHLDTGKSFGIDPAGYNDQNVSITVANGAMTLNAFNTNGFRSWRLAAPTPQDFYLQGVFKTLSCSGNDQYGLVFRAPDYSSGLGYYFGVDCNGNYSLYEWSAMGNAVVLTGNSPLINKGGNQTNRFGIRAVGNNLDFLMNDKEIQSFVDSNLPDGGHIGVFVSSYSGNLSVQLDDIAYWNIH